MEFMQNGIFLQQAMAKVHVMELVALKRLVARTSLQNNEILSVEEMFKWCKDNIKGINFINVTGSDVTDHIEHHNLEERYTTAKRLPGTRSHHSFVPRDGKLEMRRLSADQHWTAIDLVSATTSTSINKNNCHPGMYLACSYDNEWYIGNAKGISEGTDDVLVKFMKQDGVNFRWPNKEDECWIQFINVLAQVNSLKAQGHRARTYRISEHEFEEISEQFQKIHRANTL